MQFADKKQAEDYFAAHPEVLSIELFLIDANGVPRGKLLHRDELLAIYENGRPLPSSILALTVQDEDVDETGLIWDVADADCWNLPLTGKLDLATLAHQPHRPSAGQHAPDPRYSRRSGRPATRTGAYHRAAESRWISSGNGS